jgi:hypothetical protein
MRRALAVLLLAAWPLAAGAHGGLPISVRVLHKGADPTLFVPVVYWGVWVGQDGGPWRWICEEEINTNRFRRYALSTDGTFYATNVRGVTLSSDGGCTWADYSGELAQLRTTAVAVHPVDGATAWVTTDDYASTADGGMVDNALFVTHDHGQTFARVPALSGGGLRFQSVLAAPSDGNTLYVTSAALMTPFAPTVQRSIDGGASFTAYPIVYTLDGTAPYSAEVMAVDPRASDVIYVRVFVTQLVDGGDSQPLQALLRSVDGGAHFAEIYRAVGDMLPSGLTRGIDGVAVDADGGRVLVATKTGLLVGDDPGRAPTVTLAPRGNLSQAQCVDARAGKIYACGTNYAPDFAALARSDDGAATFKSVLSYQDTIGTISCPAGTPVADQCPYYWLNYSAQLGIGGTDGGGDGGGGGGSGGCGCALGGGSATATGLLLLVLALAARLLRRA